MYRCKLRRAHEVNRGKMAVSDLVLLQINLLCALFMTGLIWFVQVVHYPLMALIGDQQFRNYELQHTSRTTYVVAVPMLGELISAIWLYVCSPAWRADWTYNASTILLVVVWTSTIGLQVPLHQALAEGPNSVLVRRLVATNWLRTFAWTGRSALLTHLVWSW